MITIWMGKKMKWKGQSILGIIGNCFMLLLIACGSASGLAVLFVVPFLKVGFTGWMMVKFWIVVLGVLLIRKL